jgi:hypothetical protein
MRPAEAPIPTTGNETTSAFTGSLLAVWFLLVIHVPSTLRLVEDLFTDEPFFVFVVSISQS